MRAPLIVEPMFAVVLGRYLAGMQRARHSSFVGDGECHSAMLSAVRLTAFRYSLLPALSLNGMLYAKIVEGSFTTKLFLQFLNGLLDRMNPFPAPDSVIIMDNARIHRHPRIRELIEER